MSVHVYTAVHYQCLFITFGGVICFHIIYKLIKIKRISYLLRNKYFVHIYIFSRISWDEKKALIKNIFLISVTVVNVFFLNG